MMREILVTGDGSHTIYIPAQNVTYHSRHGAIQESRHVFIEAGLRPLIGTQQTLRIFEMGFGTGLNALLALKESVCNNQALQYTAVELYPLCETEYTALNYCKVLKDEALWPLFMRMHAGPWGRQATIHPLFTLTKVNKPVTEAVFNQTFHCIFFDAFAPGDQPELWTAEIFKKMFAILENNGILVTYCCKGEVRRGLQGAGFKVDKIAGPPGKKEMIRAVKAAL